MKSTFYLIIMTLGFFTTTSAQMPPLEAGVAQTLARWRAANYSNISYKLNITLEKGAALMKGEIEVHVKLTDEGAKNDLILDWRTTQFQNDKDKPYANVVAVNNAVDIISNVSKEHLIVPKGALKTGENVIKIGFASPVKTSGAAVTRYLDKEDGGEYIYSLFVPSDASMAFPCFDQPDLKARFNLELVVPKTWQAVSNTAGLGYIMDNKAASATYSFPETKPISTYVFAFATGDFQVFEDKSAGITTGTNKGNKNDSSNPRAVKKEESFLKISKGVLTPKIYVRKSQAEKFKQHEAEVFRLNREGVKFLESYFDYKFPFPKYDLVLIPEFPFGGMEHAGETFLREDSIIFPTEPTKNNYISRANVIFHEAAHQWFGDTVTMKWFDDLWLKEGFAEFMAYKTLEKVMPEYNSWKIFYERNKQAAYLTDSTKGTTPIYQEIPNLSAAKSAYGNIVYRKAPSFLRQAEFYLGEDKFQTAVRRFLKKHQFANAEWTDLVREFEAASGQDLKDWANAWVKQRGLPKVVTEIRPKIDIRTEGSRAGSILVSGAAVRQSNALNENGNWLMRAKFISRFRDGRTEENVVDFSKGSILETGYVHKGAEIPQFVFPNYQDYGYGIFLLDEKSRVYILNNIQSEKDDFLRAMMWGSLWDSVRETELAPADYVALVVKNINVETDESTIQTLLGRVSTAMNYYLSDKERESLAPQLENLLIDKIQNAPTLGARITYYRAFLNVASSDNARNILKQILRGNVGERGGDTKTRAGVKEVNGKLVYAAKPAIPLKAKDKFDIVTRLIILGDTDSLKLLAELEKYETDDAAKRYAYAARAGIATAENKAKFWNDFVADKEISESYIEIAFGSFNAIRHSELTLPYLEKALAELPNLKRNRKIFFVNGWLGAFIGGQKSEQALQIVNKFLADNPDLDKDLKLKILENADGLERAVKIRAKYGKN